MLEYWKIRYNIIDIFLHWYKKWSLFIFRFSLFIFRQLFFLIILNFLDIILLRNHCLKYRYLWVLNIHFKRNLIECFLKTKVLWPILINNFVFFLLLTLFLGRWLLDGSKCPLFLPLIAKNFYFLLEIVYSVKRFIHYA